ncbi:MAG: hypothetical protein DWP98_00145 [Bacteroidetes bacterium]|nr:MAG: hypothetical protein DWP98_00145 [Bacteroidota bacterium]MBL1144586.1 hypothetical protein [Bacteroidota bacterium]MCB0803391.1 tetratricopeptide repeat protein [Flavobacteriales bacterium]NOG57381.1 tetratricopeptide repeat protein [Bacteroidota bacterium]
MMKTIKLSIFTLLVSVFVACGSKSEEQNTEGESSYVALEKLDVKTLDEEIQKRSKAVENDETGDKRLAAELLKAYVAYSENFPNYEKAAEYTFRAGEIAMNLNHTAQSLKLFEVVYEDYPKYEKRPYALFMRAFVLENQAGNFDEAKRFYEEFIAEYPNHPMADDAAYSLKNMGKSPEELIREFEIQDSINAAASKAV